ncbi:MAG: sugar ABC transporter permease [Ruminococcus sp.]|nr:sugar ABC transporter permease [Ruminococcus sp.]
MTFIEYKQLNPIQRFAYNFKKGLASVPKAVGGFFKGIGTGIVSLITTIINGFRNYGTTFVKGDLFTKLSYIIFGIGDLSKGKYYKGLIYLLVEVFYIIFMASFGGQYISKFGTLGTVETTFVQDGKFKKQIFGDNSMLILLYSVLTIVVTVIVFAIYISNIKDAYKMEQLKRDGIKPSSFAEDMREYLDGKYHITLLSLPVLLIGIFNILPLIFMILIAFTSYDKSHLPPGTLFSWVGFSNFTSVFDIVGNSTRATTFIELTKWTFIWAILATFTNYILGMIVALMINKKGIKFKSLWRTLFVLAIAVPQFVSLLLMNQILQTDGAMNVLLSNITGQDVHIQFLNNSTLMARTTVVIVNCWVGIPYTILSMSGILMNIPEDLYESARIDGAGPVRTFTSITLPYMLFVTTPQLITQFVGNINNFNVIYLLTGGGPSNPDFYQAGNTDILVTWLFKLTMTAQDYNLAAAIGILVFIVCATLSLIVYNNSKSMKDEEAFS